MAQLHISDNTGTIIARHEGSVPELTAIVLKDLRDNYRATPPAVNGAKKRLARPVNGVRTTTHMGPDFKLVVAHRIYTK